MVFPLFAGVSAAGSIGVLQRQAVIIVNGCAICLSLIRK
jgi:hypothetical protein